jgi:uncharacterized cupredoxin-like copper-binding protein
MKAAAVALMAAAMLVLPACGGSSVAQPSGSIKVTMTEYKFDPGDLSAPAGKVVFYLVNAGTLSHDMVITKADGTIVGRSDLVSAGDQFVFTVDNIAAGSYKILCDQPGHADAGMRGTLTIS